MRAAFSSTTRATASMTGSGSISQTPAAMLELLRR
jgi:hypothetical protein